MTAADTMPGAVPGGWSSAGQGRDGHHFGAAQQHVTAVLVVHNGSEWLPGVLASLRLLQRRPDRVVAVDTGSIDASAELLRQATDCIDDVLTLDAGASFGEAVAAAEAALPETARNGAAPGDLPAQAPEPPVTEWLWLLHDDCAPEPGALGALLAEADRSASAGILGPKVRGWHDPALLVECGVSITNSGRRFTGIELGDRDQGQRDGLSDVLAVGSPGMLVRRDVWQRLGGFDPHLRMFGDDVEFCMRARRADERVVVVPSAVVHHREAGLHGLRSGSSSSGPPTLAGRAAGLYTILVHGPVWLLPMTSILLLARTLVAALVLLPTAGPRRSWAELQVWFGVHLHPIRVLRARRALRRVASVPRRDMRPLRPGLVEQWSLAVERSVVGRRSDSPSGIPRPPRNVGTGLALAGVLVAVAGLATSAVWSSRGTLVGGALLPPVDGSTLWSAFRASWHDVGLGSAEPAAPYTLALLGLAAPPGISVDFIASALLLFTVPLAGLSAFLALRGVPRRGIRAGLALAYALTPTAVVPSLDGRLGTAAVAILLPWLARLVFRMFAGSTGLLPEATLRTAATASAVLAVCASFAPLMWVAAVVLILVAAVLRARSLRTWVGAAVLVLVPIALLWPWSAAVFADPSRTMFEAGLTSPDLVASQPPGWHLLLLDPGTLGPDVGWVAVPLLTLAVGAVLWSRSRPVAVWGWWIVAVGLAGATAATSQLFVPLGATTAQHAFAGPMLLLMAVGLVVAVAGATTVSGPVVHRRGRAVSALGIAVLAAGPAFLSALWIVDFSGPLQRTDETVVPAFVVEEALSPDRVRTLLLAETDDAAISYALQNGAGPRLGDADVAPPAETWREISAAVGGLAAGVGPQPVQVLADNAVRFLIAEAADEELAAALDGNSALRRLSTTDGRGLWEIEGVTARARLQEGGLTRAVPIIDSGQLDQVEIGVAERSGPARLIVAQANDGDWSADSDGAALPVAGDLMLAMRMDPGAPASVVLEHDRRSRERALLVPLAAALLLMLLLPVRRRDDAVPDPDQEPPGSPGAPAVQLDLTDTAREARG